MKQISNILSLLFLLSFLYSCEKAEVAAPNFKDKAQNSITDYIEDNKANYSSFLAILEKTGIDNTLRAYNPKGVNYTLFLPDNHAVEEFIKGSSEFSSLDELLKDTTYVNSLARYHVVRKGFLSFDFPFGVFSEPTLSGDFLNVNFILSKDTTYYKINNQASITKVNVKDSDDKYFSNGFIHVIGSMLKPIAYNSYNWLKNNPGYSIFTSALEKTGYADIINVNMKEENQPLRPFTMLIEHDSIYHKRNIFSFDDLTLEISPGRSDYTNSANPMNQFAGYHILNRNRFLDQLQGYSSSYNTFSDIPLSINGLGLDVYINKGKEEFVSQGDTTDFVLIYYDASNVNTQSGSIHFINQILKPQIPSQANVSFQFWEEQFLSQYRQKGGTYEIESPDLLDYVNWTGAKLFYVKSFDNSERARSKDYMMITGLFNISYQVPKIIMGKYDVFLRADAYSQDNALVELYIDGDKIGGLIDLTKGGKASDPYALINVGSIDFKKYESHVVELKSLVSGRLKWDYISFNIHK